MLNLAIKQLTERKLIVYFCGRSRINKENAFRSVVVTSTSACNCFRNKGAKGRIKHSYCTLHLHYIEFLICFRLLVRGDKRKGFWLCSSMEHDGCSNLTYSVVIHAKNKCTHAEQ